MELTMNCLDCAAHKIIRDPDPHDWFCDDDVANVCTLTPNPDQDTKSIYPSKRSEYRAITVACRPYNIRKESEQPDWCPKLNN